MKVVAGYDVDQQCKFPYEENNDATFFKSDVREICGDEISSNWGKGRSLLAGCAPCQPFSTYSRKGRNERRDDKWTLVSEFQRLIQESNPDMITMENVPQFFDHEVFKDFVASLSEYHVWHNVVDCKKYGVPQTRKRIVLLGSKLGPIELLPPESECSTTVGAAIKHLPRIKAGQTHKTDKMHVSCTLSELNMERIKASKPGGTWRDWKESLLAECHSKKTGETYPSVYGRMEWDSPAPTITTQCFGYGNGRFGHPTQNRAISLREAAILQTFPDSYKFLPATENPKFSVMGRLIGNAVPVKLGEAIGKSIVAHCKKFG